MIYDKKQGIYNIQLYIVPPFQEKLCVTDPSMEDIDNRIGFC